MPNIKSAIKRVKVNQKKADQNKMKKSELRTVVKKAKASVADSADKAADQIKVAQVALDKAAAKGLIHKKAAARKKSRMVKAMKTAQAAK